MVDRFTTVTRTGYGKRIGGAFGGVIIGLILFVAAFGVLYWNEGRTNMSDVGKEAIEIDSSNANPDAYLDGKLVSASGKFITTETLGDDYLQAGNYIALQRTVEMYAWDEEKEDKETENFGGSSTTTTTYTYDREWMNSVPNSNEFNYSAGHENPAKKIDNLTKKATNAKLGLYAINLDSVTLPDYTSLALNNRDAIIAEMAGLNGKLEGNYIFYGQGTITNPEIGDLRISYSVVNSGIETTVFGKLDGDKISSYLDEDNNKLYRVFTGSREDALATMHTEYVTSLWIFRAVGFLMMWIGLGLFLGPLSIIASVVPFFGKMTRTITGLISLIAALVFSIITILISILIHNVIALIIVGVIIVIAIVLIVIGIKKRKQSAPPPPPAQ